MKNYFQWESLCDFFLNRGVKVVSEEARVPDVYQLRKHPSENLLVLQWSFMEYNALNRWNCLFPTKVYVTNFANRAFVHNFELIKLMLLIYEEPLSTDKNTF